MPPKITWIIVPRAAGFSMDLGQSSSSKAADTSQSRALLFSLTLSPCCLLYSECTMTVCCRCFMSGCFKVCNLLMDCSPQQNISISFNILRYDKDLKIQQETHNKQTHRSPYKQMHLYKIEDKRYAYHFFNIHSSCQ